MFSARSAPDGLDAVRDAIASAPSNAVVLIDGPSGSGKSTLADTVLEQWPTDAAPQLIRLDDVYPGWHGLEAGAEQLRSELLLPRARGVQAGWRRWDWSVRAPAEWHPVLEEQPVIVEGCGAFIGDAVDYADIAVWVSADDAVRKERALTRDAGGFDAHWDEWQQQWERYVAAFKPQQRAQFTLTIE